MASTFRRIFSAGRAFLHARSLLAVAVVTIALGVGASAVSFSLFDRILFRPLPYREPQQLVQVESRLFRPGGPFVDGAATLNLAVTQALAGQKDLFSGVAWAAGGVARGVSLSSDENSVLWLSAVTYEALDVLGVRPVVGPGLSAAGTSGGDDRQVVLTYDVWQARYGGSDDVLSLQWTTRELRQGETSVVRWRVVGVLPQGFLLPTSNSVSSQYDGLYGIDSGLDRQVPMSQIGIAPFARLAPGVSAVVAQARVDAIVRATFAHNSRIDRVRVVPLDSGMLFRVRPYVWLAMAGTWAVLAATCLTLTILLLTWSHSRRHEAGVRLSLGASPSDLLATALWESVLLCGLGGVVGWLGYVWVRSLLIKLMPAGLHAFATETVDLRVLVATSATTSFCAIVAGALPAIRTSRTSPLDVLRDQHRSSAASRLVGGSLLLSMQAGFGVILLVGACATAPAVLRFLLQSPGYDPRDLFAVAVPPASDDKDRRNVLEEVRHAFAMVAVVRSLPGVVEANLSTDDPFSTGPAATSSATRSFWPSRGVIGRELGVDSGFFRTVREPIVAGRAFSDGDVKQQAPVAILNERASQVLWPGARASEVLGREITTEDGQRVVVGIAADLRIGTETMATPDLFLPLSANESYQGKELHVLLRMAPGREPDRALLWTKLRDQAVVPPMMRTMIQSVMAPLVPTLEKTRVLALVFGILGGLTLTLTTIAVYGLTSFEIGRRRDDLTIRLAIGATHQTLRRRIAIVTVRPVAAGVLGGLPGGWVLAKLLSGWIPHVDANDVLVYVVAATAVLFAALLAAWAPGRRLSALRAAAVLRPS